MKLKGWGNRAYNIFFHLHTVSGIVISVALFVIFFAGAFTLFKTEFYLWENPSARKTQNLNFNPQQILEKIANSVDGFDLNDDTFVSMATNESPIIHVYGHIKLDDSGEEVHYEGKMNPTTLELNEQAPSAIGDTLYRLHFLDQIPVAGRFLAGFISLFFVFATVTGLLVHWKNMFTKFWSFSLSGTWKQLWTNAHTVFGLLGLPFQLMYAITGAFYLLLILVLMPSVMVLYEGKPEKVYAMAYPAYGVEYDDAAQRAELLNKLPALHDKVKAEYGEQFNILGIQTHHLLKEDAVVNYRFSSRNDKIFSSHGYVGYRLADGSEIYSSMPGVNKKFEHTVIEAIMHLHFASFGGILVKGIYFLMSLFTCFVIISGILMWKEARNNKNYSDKQKRFHQRITIVFLSVCFSLFPATAILFSAELLIPAGSDHVTVVNTTFFVAWLALSLFGILLDKERKLTHFYLWAGALFSLAVPLINGLTTSDWFWQIPVKGVWITDVFWLVTGGLCLSLLSAFKKNKNRTQTRQDAIVTQDTI